MPETPSSLDAAGLQPLLRFAAILDLGDRAAALEALEAEFPFAGAWVQGLGALMKAGVEGGSLCDRGELPVRFSRVFKAGEASEGFSADAVLMTGPGPRHEHPAGEIDLCFALDGAPRFDGHAAGWVVYGPGSEHVPTVSGGTMVILYLLPGGAIRFLKG